MKRRKILLSCVGGTPLILFPSRWPIGGAPRTHESPDVNELLNELWAAYYTGCFRSDYGYAIPYFDRTWAQLPADAENSVRAVILEHRQKLLVHRRVTQRSKGKPAHG